MGLALLTLSTPTSPPSPRFGSPPGGPRLRGLERLVAVRGRVEKGVVVKAKVVAAGHSI